ncbi:MAG: transposase, partial [Acutalibacteraceae bacterium]
MYEKTGPATAQEKARGVKKLNSLSHTKRNYKYHIVFAPKYRRKVFYGEKRDGIGRMLRTLCEWKRGKIVG